MRFHKHLPMLGEPGSEFSYFIPEARNFAEVTRLSEYIRKYWLKEKLKDIKGLISNNKFYLMWQKRGSLSYMYGCL